MIGATIRGVRNAASNFARSAASRRESRPSSIQMFTNDPNRRTTFRRVSTLPTDDESFLQRALTLQAKKTEEYERMDRKLENLEAEKAKLLQEIEDLKEEITDELGLDNYKFLRAFCRDMFTAIDFEEHFGFLPSNKSMAICISSMKDLLKKEEDLRLTKQQILEDTARLAKAHDSITATDEDISTLRERLQSSPEPKKMMDATKVHLPNWKQEGELTANTTSLANLGSYPVSPMEVEEISTSNFLKFCEDHGYIDILNNVETTVDFVNAFAYMNRTTTLNDESSVAEAFRGAVKCLTLALNQTSAEPNSIPEDLSLYARLVRGLVGRADFAINCKSEDGDPKPLIMGEFKGPGFPTTNLAKQYCSKKCQNPLCGSQRHEDHSVIRQLYNYMVLNEVLVGIYTNYVHTHVFIRDGQGHLLITEAILWNQEGDIDNEKISTLQLVALAILLAADERTMNFHNYGHSMMVPCNSNDRLGVEDLPPECYSKFDLKRPKKGSSQPSSPNGRPPSSTLNKYGAKYTKDGEAVELVKLRKAGYTALSPGRTGSVFRLNFHEAGDDKSDNVVKILDLVKQADQMHELDNEAEIYKQLEPLQGIHIPEFIDCGVFDEGFLYGLGTKYSGEPLRPEDITDDFVEKAVDALDDIHSHGVLHGDVATRNILYNKETQRPVIIDFGMSVGKSEMSEEDFALSASREIARLRLALERERTTPK